MLANGAAKSKGGYVFRTKTTQEFIASARKPSWLVRGVLVSGQPAVIGGPKKSLKTSLVVDLAVSIGSGTPFLGRFPVPQNRRVAVLSGESGDFTLAETIKRVCQARSVDPSTINALWGTTLPHLSSELDLDSLSGGLADEDVEVVILDPLYLCLLAGASGRDLSASNLYDMGPLLRSAASACLDAGATPILVHHSKKGVAHDPFEPLELDDLAFSGVQEFARQWVLINRREAYEPGVGEHRLWLSVGGSVGHGGLWAVDVAEGVQDENFTGRRWNVSVQTADDARAECADSEQAKKDRRTDRITKANGTKILAALDELAKDRPSDGAARNKVRGLAKLSGQAMERATLPLIRDGVVEEVEVVSGVGKGHKAKRPVPGLRRPGKATEAESGTIGTNGTEGGLAA